MLAAPDTLSKCESLGSKIDSNEETLWKRRFFNHTADMCCGHVVIIVVITTATTTLAIMEISKELSVS